MTKYKKDSPIYEKRKGQLKNQKRNHKQNQESSFTSSKIIFIENLKDIKFNILFKSNFNEGNKF